MIEPFYLNISQDNGRILHTWIDQDGKRRRGKCDYYPTLFLNSPLQEDPNSSIEYHTIRGKRVYPVNPGNMPATRKFLERYKDVQGFDVYGFNRFQYEFLSTNYQGEMSTKWRWELINVAYLDIEVKSDEGFPDPKVADKQITAITIKDNSGIRVYGLKPYNKPIPGGTYHYYTSELTMLRVFLEHWMNNYPDVVTGWNIKGFDIPYLIQRITNLLGEAWAKRLSPWEKIKTHSKTFFGKEEITHELVGLACLDMMQLYKKYGPPGQKESYSLNYISYLELKEKKLSYDEYGSLQKLYEMDHDKYIDYNIRDVLLVEKIEKKRGLIRLAMTLAYDSKVNYEDVFYQTRMWDALIYNHLTENNIASNLSADGEKDHAYEGAYVKDPILGRHKWVVSFDYTSLYPSLMMQFNISPDTIVEPCDYTDEIAKLISETTIEKLVSGELNTEALKKNNMILTANAQVFTNKFVGFLPIILRKMFADRQKYKGLMLKAKGEVQDLKRSISVAGGKENMAGYTYDEIMAKIADAENRVALYDILQQCKKVCLNSCYGATGTPYFRYFDIRQAVAVTLSGQYAIKYVERELNKHMNNLLDTEGEDYVVAIDTDSVYLVLDKLVAKAFPKGAEDKTISVFLDRASKEGIQPFLKNLNKHISEYTNATTVDLDLKRESICNQAIWTAKKRYILAIQDQEGTIYDTPEIKSSGLEVVKSSTPEVCRTKLKEAIQIIVSGTEQDAQAFIAKFKLDFMKLPPEDIAFPRGLNGLGEYADPKTIWGKGAPIHVKGGLIYNHYLKARNLEKQYPLIQEGEKIKFLYIKERNPLGITVISFPQVLPKEFVDIVPYIDYNTQFEKAFLDPLNIILHSVNWNAEPKSSLESFWT